MSRIAPILASVLLIFGVLAYHFTGDVLTKRHQVHRFAWALPPGRPPELSDSLALDAISRAFSDDLRDPGLWAPLPRTDGSAVSMLRIGRNPNSALVILTNRMSAQQLYASSISVTLSRPK